jgi:hypothetical protein
VSTGKVVACTSPCVKCQNTPDSCLSCIEGYSPKGDRCFDNNNAAVDMALKGGSGSTAIFT